MHARTWAIWIGGVAAGIAAGVIGTAVIVFVEIASGRGLGMSMPLMIIVVGTTTFAAGWAAEELLGWTNFVQAVGLGLFIGLVAVAPLHVGW